MTRGRTIALVLAGTVATAALVAYAGWVSLEIFTVPEDPSAVLGETMDYLKDIERSLSEGS